LGAKIKRNKKSVDLEEFWWYRFFLVFILLRARLKLVLSGMMKEVICEQQ